MTDGTAEKLTAVGEFMTKLTGSRVALTFAFAVLSIASFTMFENRVMVFNTILSSPMIMGALGGGAIISLVGWIFRIIVVRMDEAQSAKDALLKSHNSILEGRIAVLEGDAKDDRAYIIRVLDKIANKLGA